MHDAERALVLPVVSRAPRRRDRYIGLGLDELVRCLRRDSHLQPLIIATDGGSQGRKPAERMGSWSAIYRDCKIGGPLPGIDQSAPAAEAYAAAQIAAAAERAGIYDFFLIIDNLQTARATTAAVQGEIIPTAYRGAWMAIANSFRGWREARVPVDGSFDVTYGPKIVRTPSHNKKKGEWSPPVGITEEACRTANDAADCEATKHLKNHLRESDDYLREKREAVRWAGAQLVELARVSRL